MAYVKWFFIIVFWVLVAAFFHYTLPQKDIVRITDTYEQLTVIDGMIEVTSGENSSQLEQGDTARYAADVPHAIRASGAAKAFLIVHDA